ncbi:MAG: cytochrome c peroxidase [Afipia sp.]|nr:cytochrome c peroxidase [Afipia sp.]
MKRLFAAILLAAPLLANGSILSAQEIKPVFVVRPPGTSAATLPRREALRRGQALFSDKRLSTSDTSCASCHADLQAFNDSFRRPYPHPVQMAKDMSGLESVNAETMVQFCMLVPMAAQPFTWDSADLAALTAYVEKLRIDFAAR